MQSLSWRPGGCSWHGKAQNKALVHLLRIGHSLDTCPQSDPWYLEGHVETHSWEIYTKNKELCPLHPYFLSERTCDDITIKLEKKGSLDDTRPRYRIQKVLKSKKGRNLGGRGRKDQSNSRL